MMEGEERGQREADITLGTETASRERWGLALVICAFGVAFAAGVGFMFIYWTGGSNLLLGGTLALACAGFGVALVLWSHWLMEHRQAIEPREPMPSAEPEREAAEENFCAGAREVRRRKLLLWMSAGGVGLLAAMGASLLRSLGVSPNFSLYSTVWKRGQRLVTIDGKAVTVNALKAGNSITVFPEESVGSERAQTVLVRVDEKLLQLPKDRTGWAPMGYVAYSRVCTHAGCVVGMFEPRANLLLCPCHQSTFDVLNGAVPTGGPAARALPQLPLYTDSNGDLRAAGGFSEPPGPGFWGMP